MSEYRKLDFSKLNFSDDVISHEEVLENITPFELENDVIFGQKKIKVAKAERDYENKCVKLEIYC